MAKQKKTCYICGGSFDGTPSGQRKHEQTDKHQKVKSGENAPFGAPRPDVTGPANAETVAKAAQVAHEKILASSARASKHPDAEAVSIGLHALEQIKSEELARRQADHAWRVRNRADEAEAYYEAKVAPLRKEMETLRAARLLIEAAYGASEE